MSGYERAVFISYAPGGKAEEIVNQVQTTLQARGLSIVLDQRALGYKGSINKFIERMGRGDCVVLIISDRYLRSADCMHALIEIAENKQFTNRIFPIVLEDAEIYDPIKQIKYIKHWEAAIEELENAVKEVKAANLHGIRETIDLYDDIRDKISGLTSTLKDMNSLTIDMHKAADFGELYDAISERMGGNLPTSAKKTRIEEMSLDDWGKSKVNTSGVWDWLKSQFKG